MGLLLPEKCSNIANNKREKKKKKPNERISVESWERLSREPFKRNRESIVESGRRWRSTKGIEHESKVWGSSPVPHSLSLCCCCSVAQSRPALCVPLDCSTPGFPVLHYLPEFAQTHVRWVSDTIQPSHPLSPCLPALNCSQHQGLFQWAGPSH